MKLHQCNTPRFSSVVPFRKVPSVYIRHLHPGNYREVFIPVHVSVMQTTPKYELSIYKAKTVSAERPCVPSLSLPLPFASILPYFCSAPRDVFGRLVQYTILLDSYLFSLSQAPFTLNVHCFQLENNTHTHTIHNEAALATAGLDGFVNSHQVLKLRSSGSLRGIYLKPLPTSL